MYYEGRIKSFKKFDSLSELVVEIKKIFYSECLYWCKDNEVIIGVANDQSTCEGVLEAALLNLSDGVQVDSLTLGWINKSEWENSIRNCFNTPFGCADTPFLYENETIVKKEKETKSWFTCGCCGSDFKSNYEEQEKFGQDVGYGICPKCEHHYS